MTNHSNTNYYIRKYSCFVLGMAILAFGLYNIHSRCDVTEGGVLGAILLIEHWFSISPAISSFLLDAACFAFGTAVLGKAFLMDSAIAAALFSVWYALFEHIGPLLPNYSQRPLTAAVIGALFVGVGTGLIVIYGGACGGDDALALALSKKYHLPISSVYVFSDLIVLLLSLSYIPVSKIAWSILSVMISSAVIQVISNTAQKLSQKRQVLR